MVGDAIVKHCGGLANFIHVTNCMTRVRMTIADTSLVDMTALKAIGGIRRCRRRYPAGDRWSGEIDKSGWGY
nr:PTS transporter subunit EIIB [Klebsiella pneumoniae]